MLLKGSSSCYDGLWRVDHGIEEIEVVAVVWERLVYGVFESISFYSSSDCFSKGLSTWKDIR
jgi:hypothetical protein